MIDVFRRCTVLLLVLSFFLSSVGSTVTVNQEFEVSGFKNYTIDSTAADFSVAVTEKVSSNAEPVQQADIELDEEGTLETSNLSKALFNVTLTGNMANAATVTVRCSGMLDRSDSSKYIPVTLSASLSKTPTSYYYTNYDKRERNWGSRYYYYYYRYYNESSVTVPSNISSELNKASGSSSIPINWYITKEYFKTNSASSSFSVSNSDRSQGDPTIATDSSEITGCPKRNNNSAMTFTTSVDFSLGITTADWNAYKEDGHTYSMDFDIYVTVSGS